MFRYSLFISKVFLRIVWFSSQQNVIFWCYDCSNTEINRQLKCLANREFFLNTVYSDRCYCFCCVRYLYRVWEWNTKPIALYFDRKKKYYILYIKYYSDLLTYSFSHPLSTQHIHFYSTSFIYLLLFILLKICIVSFHRRAEWEKIHSYVSKLHLILWAMSIINTMICIFVCF